MNILDTLCGRCGVFECHVVVGSVTVGVLGW